MLNLPNLLSIFRILLVPPLVVVLLTKFEGKEWWGLGLFLLAAVMDFFDGYLARRRQQVTRLGTLLDPAADKILISAAFISLVELDLAHRAGLDRGGHHRPRVRRHLAAQLRRGRDLVIPAGFSGKVKTIVQIISVALLIIYNQLGEFRHLAPISLWVAMADHRLLRRRVLRALRPALPGEALT